PVGKTDGSSHIPDGSASATATDSIIGAIVDTGRTVTINDVGEGTGLANLLPAWRQSIILAVGQRRLGLGSTVTARQGKAAGLRGQTGANRALELISPIGTAVESRTPVMTWKALDTGLSYEVSIFDSDYQEVVSSGSLTGTTWKVALAL